MACVWETEKLRYCWFRFLLEDWCDDSLDDGLLGKPVAYTKRERGDILIADGRSSYLLGYEAL